ncbi:hypothetical protein Rhopal_004406-T1 [Rhodotorula paludigena]|uniref:Uncharacterized protein n=1 Tax=Rhodotorula paludigena TaxID=86838 RepID=A0AAV5GFQ8_9BASI|nr:hypothetical protein Rhopal_004406-T1 [Rhodotorula paludigena]
MVDNGWPAGPSARTASSSSRTSGTLMPLEGTHRAHYGGGPAGNDMTQDLVNYLVEACERADVQAVLSCLEQLRSLDLSHLVQRKHGYKGITSLTAALGCPSHQGLLVVQLLLLRGAKLDGDELYRFLGDDDYYVAEKGLRIIDRFAARRTDGFKLAFQLLESTVCNATSYLRLVDLDSVSFTPPPSPRPGPAKPSMVPQRPLAAPRKRKRPTPTEQYGDGAKGRYWEHFDRASSAMSTAKGTKKSKKPKKKVRKEVRVLSPAEAHHEPEQKVDEPPRSLSPDPFSNSTEFIQLSSPTPPPAASPAPPSHVKSAADPSDLARMKALELEERDIRAILRVEKLKAQVSAADFEAVMRVLRALGKV